MSKDLSFEMLIEEIEINAEKLKSDGLGIDESIKLYEECVKLYDQASKMLEEKKQKIQIYDPEKEELEDFENV